MNRYTALIDGQAGAYGIVFPDLPGCAAMGKTIEAAIANAGAAMRDWAEVTLEMGGVLPDPRALEELRQDADVVAALAEGSTLASVPMIRDSGKPAKANLSLDTGLLAAIDAEATRRKLTRSAFVEMMARRALLEMA